MSNKKSVTSSRISQFDAEFSIPWEQAFSKFGFDDGDYSLTDNIAEFLEYEDYEVEVSPWGLHNDVISSIKKGGKELIPHNNPEIALGYTDPRNYLPKDVIAILDDCFPI